MNTTHIAITGIVLAGLAVAACGDDETGSSGAGAAPASTSSTSASSSSSGVGGSAGDGGGGTGAAGGGAPVGCQSNEDCAGDPGGPVCDPGSKTCVECLPSGDDCDATQYCDANTYTCTAGCDDSGDCIDPDPHCDTASHMCVNCLEDSHCPLGKVCDLNTKQCSTGCSQTQGCGNGLSCCGSICFDLTADTHHCGDCDIDCSDPENAPPNADVSCSSGACLMGACNSGWADCNGLSDDGCENNVFFDGACTCTPGGTQSCYTGAPGTLGIGTCAAGTQTCNPDGTSWGACAGQVLPVYEVCGNGLDENCDNIVDNVVDLDGDGWSYCQGDCCEVPGPGCPTPALINPGAFEVIGNLANDDCDASTSDTVVVLCSTAEDFSGVTASDVAMAMDICQTTTASPPLPEKKWGLLSATLLLANGTAPSAATLLTIQNQQTAILVDYGTGGVVPKRGATMAGISTGWMRDQGDAGYAGTSSALGSTSTPPAAYLAAHGGSLPASLGCSGTCPAGSGANDSVNVRLSIRVPTNAKSLSYDFRFASSEYWNFPCTIYNDFYLALLQSGAANIPADKNISFDSQNNPVSVNNSFFEICVAKGCYSCPDGSGALAGTGLQVANTGGSTSWLTTDAPVVPGETIQLDLVLFDVSDQNLDSIILLDNLRWNLQTAVVGTHE